MTRFLTCAAGHFWVPEGLGPPSACPLCAQPSTLDSQLRCLRPRTQVGCLLIVIFLVLMFGPGLLILGLVGFFQDQESSLFALTAVCLGLVLTGIWLWRRGSPQDRQRHAIAATLNFRCASQIPQERRPQLGQWPFCQQGTPTVAFWAEGFFRDAHLALLDLHLDLGPGEKRQHTMVLFLDRQTLPNFQLGPLPGRTDHWDRVLLELVGLRKPLPDQDWSHVYEFQLDPGPEGQQVFRPAFTSVVAHHPFLAFACRDGLLAVSITSCASQDLPLFLQAAWELRQRLLTGLGDTEGIDPS